MKKTFNHPHKSFKPYSNKYVVDTNGKVYNKIYNRYLKIHKNPKSNNLFVRLSSGKGVTLSIGINKLMLLTFKGKKYKPGKIAVRINGDAKDISLKNLKWGSRKLQSKIAMKNPVNKNRVQKWGKNMENLTGKKILSWTEKHCKNGKKRIT